LLNGWFANAAVVCGGLAMDRNKPGPSFQL